MRGVDLVVAIGADEEHVAALRIGRQAHDEIDRGEVGPLEIVEEEHERVAALRERRDQALDGGLEAVAGLRGRDLLERWLRPDELLELGDHGDEGAAALARERARLELGAAEEARADELAQRLDETVVGRGSVELIELARDEDRACRDHGLLHRRDERGLADARVAGDEEHPRAADRGPLERVEHDGDLALATEEARGDVERRRPWRGRGSA